MATKKNTRSTIITEGKFDNIYPPNLDLFNITLKEREYQIKNSKTEDLISSEKTFEIFIEVSKVSKTFINILSEDLKAAFRLKFAPFNKDTKSYNFYVTSYITMEERKKILEDIFDTLKEFQNTYQEKLAEIIPTFNKAKEEIKDFETEDFDFRFSDKLNTFVVVAKSFLGSDNYIKLARSSIENGKVQDNTNIQELYSNKKYSKKTFFIINQSEYIAINDFIRNIQKKQINFLDNQGSFFNDNNLLERYKKIEYENPNIFNYKLKINEERKCFDFFCKGYEASSYEYKVTPRGLIPLWALNFIFSTPLELLKNSLYEIDEEITRNGFVKEELSYQNDSSKKDKSYLVPFTKIETLERINQNFLKEIEFWSKEQFNVKKPVTSFSKTHSNGLNLDKYPAIFLNSDGQAFFMFDLKQTSSKKANTTLLNMRGFKITPEEFLHFTTKHDFAENIKQNTIFLNSQVWAGTNFFASEKDMENAYNDVLMAYKINNIKKDTVQIKRIKL